MTRNSSLGVLATLAVAGLCTAQLACSGGTPNPQPEATGAAAPAAGTAVQETPAAAPSAPAPAPAPAAAPAPRPAPAPPAAARPAAPAPPPPPRTFTLASGTSIAVHTTSGLSTAVNKTGEPFSATLAEPIVDGDWVVAQRGARVEGVIVESDPGGRTKGVASLTLGLTRLTLADGRTVELSTGAVTEEANTSKGKDAKKIGIGAGVGAAIGAIAGGGQGAAIGAAVGGGAGTAAALATRGDPATVPSESLVTFVVSSPVTITRR